jgi:Family of unknown function (DUF6221)
MGDWAADLIPFMNARLDEDERADWHVYDCTGMDFGDGCCRVPERVRREIAAKRARLALYLDAKETLATALKNAPPENDPATEHSYARERINVNQASGRLIALETSVRLDAEIYSDHPDYRQEWAP